MKILFTSIRETDRVKTPCMSAARCLSQLPFRKENASAKSYDYALCSTHSLFDLFDSFPLRLFRHPRIASPKPAREERGGGTALLLAKDDIVGVCVACFDSPQEEKTHKVIKRIKDGPLLNPVHVCSWPPAGCPSRPSGRRTWRWCR